MPKFTIEGTWYNELGSEMILTLDKTDRRQINGTYETFVSSCAKGKYPVTGRTDTDNDSAQNVGFVVSWENENGSCDSVTTWSGELQLIDDEEILTTFWLLTMETSPNANWKSTLVGKDVFRRTRPNDEQIAKALGVRTYSNPH